MSDPITDRDVNRIRVTNRMAGQVIQVACPNCMAAVRFESYMSDSDDDDRIGRPRFPPRSHLLLRPSACQGCGSQLTPTAMMSSAPATDTEFDIRITGVAPELNPTDEPSYDPEFEQRFQDRKRFLGGSWKPL